MANHPALSPMIGRLGWMMGCWVTRGYFTPMQYFERFQDVSMRTFRRDLDRLEEAGFLYSVPLGPTDASTNAYRYVTFRSEPSAA